jgi:hypothetical protein
LSIRWENSLSAGLERIAAAANDLSQDARVGGEVILEEALKLVPKRTGDLAESGMVQEWRGGRNTTAVIFGSVYARYVHEHLHFQHPFGGQSKYLESAMLIKGEEAVNASGEHFWNRL